MNGADKRVFTAGEGGTHHAMQAMAKNIAGGLGGARVTLSYSILTIHTPPSQADINMRSLLMEQPCQHTSTGQLRMHFYLICGSLTVIHRLRVSTNTNAKSSETVAAMDQSMAH